MSAVSAIVSSHWAILPEALQGIIALAERRQDDPALVAMREKAIEEGRWPPRPDALLVTGAVPLEGAPRRVYRREGVAIIPVIGAIIPHASIFAEVSGAVSVDFLTAAVRAAAANDEIKTIAMIFDSPGGAVPGIQELAGRIVSTGAQKRVESYAYGNTASAAYWLASAAARLTVAPTAVLGSIGIVAAIPVQEGTDAMGMRRIEIVSSNAPRKRPDPRSDDGAADIRVTLDSLETVFVDAVAAQRHVTREKVMSDFGKGGVMVGAEAVKAGMADAVLPFDAWLDRLVGEATPPRRRMAAESYLKDRAA
jgi:ClpP class serine protease